MRVILTIAALLLSIGAAQAAKFVPSGRPLILYSAWSTNPDCTAAGPVEMRVAQGPEHGRVSIRRTGLFPNFPPSNMRNVCNRRRVPGVQATYVSERNYIGSDLVVLEVFYPRGRAQRVTVPIQVM